MENIQIHAIVTDGLQTRAALNEDVVAEYGEIMKNGGKLPPVTVFRDVFTDYLADGFHRLEAAKRLGRIDIEAEVRDGDRTAALRYALKANAAHGLRRTNEDKRRALQLAWEHRDELFGREPSVRELAEQTAVSVGNAHAFLQDMKVFKLNTCENQGRREGTPETGESKGEGALATEKGMVDRYGVAVPEGLVDAFAQKRLMKMFRLMRTIAAEIERAKESGDYLFARVSQSTLITIRNAAADLKAEAPWCVCRQCGGRGCRACGELGVQTKLEYERNPVELKG